MTVTEEPADVTGEEATNLQPQAAIDDAFIKSGLHEFNGFKLQPWSPARIVAAQAMGLHYGSVDEAGRERFKTDKIYPGAQRDMTIVLWLCSLKTEEEADAAGRAPNPAMTKAYKFASEHGLLDSVNDTFWKGFIVFLDIMNEVSMSRVKAEKKSQSESLMTTPVTT